MISVCFGPVVVLRGNGNNANTPNIYIYIHMYRQGENSAKLDGNATSAKRGQIAQHLQPLFHGRRLLFHGSLCCVVSALVLVWRWLFAMFSLPQSGVHACAVQKFVNLLDIIILQQNAVRQKKLAAVTVTVFT